MLKKVSASFGSALFSLALLGYLIGVLAERFYIGELAVNVRWQIGVAALLALPFLGFGGSRWRSAGAAALVVLTVLPAARLAWSAHAETEGGHELRVATVNVLADNRSVAPFDAWLVSEQPDVVAVLELSRFWSEHVNEDSPLAAYPHRVEEARPSSFGIGLYSRYPILTHEIIEIGDAGAPQIMAVVDIEGCAVEVWAVHTFPPITPAMWSARNGILDTIAGMMGEGPAVVMGDLNATLYSPAFEQFLSDAGLVDSRVGMGREASWMPLLGPLGLDLDHVLVRAPLATRSRRLSPQLGSDHLGVVADIVIPDRACVRPATAIPAPAVEVVVP